MSQGYVNSIVSSTTQPLSNVIIGGNFDLNPWQRGTSFTGITSTALYTADRFHFLCNGTGVVSISNQTDAPSVAQCGMYVQRSLQVAVTTSSIPAAGDYYILRYKMEGFDWASLYQSPFAYSLWIKPSVSGIMCCSFNNNGQDYSFIKEVSLTANVWQQIQVLVPASPAAGTQNFGTGCGLFVDFTIAAGSNFQGNANAWTNQSARFITSNAINGVSSNTNTFKFALVKLEPGNVVTAYPFESRVNVLARCERYYQTSYITGGTPGSISSSGCRNYITAAAYGAGTNMTWDNFRVSMRAAPTVTIYSNNTGLSGKFWNANAGADMPCTVAAPGTSGYILNTTNATSAANVMQWHYAADAEI